MTMHFDITFKNARIPVAHYGRVIGWTDEEVTEEPERAAELALAHVESILEDGASDIVQNSDGINLDGAGFQDSAGNDFSAETDHLLTCCEPGARLYQKDAENSSGRSWCVVLETDGNVREIEGVPSYPGVDSPEDLPGLLNTLRTPLAAYLNGYTTEDRLTAAINLAEPVRALLAEYDRLIAA